MYQPATAPSRLLVEGRVPWKAPVPAPGASNVAKTPPADREKPCIALLASKNSPVTTPCELIENAPVPSPAAPGASNVVNSPSRVRTKPWQTGVESQKYPVTVPSALMLAGLTLSVGELNTVILPSGARTKPG